MVASVQQVDIRITNELLSASPTSHVARPYPQLIYFSFGPRRTKTTARRAHKWENIVKWVVVVQVSCAPTLIYRNELPPMLHGSPTAQNHGPVPQGHPTASTLAQCRVPATRNCLRPTNAVGEHHGTHALVQRRSPTMHDSPCSHQPPMPHPIPTALVFPCHTYLPHDTRRNMQKGKYS
ncbi:hypothetical protein PIB30_080046 [Stylosanthes scabra]|uniref:Uncharacterized protein n=1 Tax=Stylosanthes scabra TaxID=79078 RepID=A0ABU6QS68_9FABA|nr:hypothetical protein [Stylosanthes scabra]